MAATTKGAHAPARRLPAGTNDRSTEEQNALVLDHLDLVDHVVNQLAIRYPRHVDRDDLWNAGAYGLVQAARRYKPETGVPFPRYATVRIRGAVIDSTRDRDWVARSVRRGVRSLREAEATFEERHGREASDEDLAAMLGVNAATIRAHREAAANSTVLRLDAAVDGEEPLTETIRERHEVHLPEARLEARELNGTLRTAIEHLPPTHRAVIERYYLGGEMLREIAQSFGVTEARISQLCNEAVHSLRAYLGTIYEGVPEVPAAAPGKRARASYLARLAAQATWRSRLEAAGTAMEEAS